MDRENHIDPIDLGSIARTGLSKSRRAVLAHKGPAKFCTLQKAQYAKDNPCGVSDKSHPEKSRKSIDILPSACTMFSLKKIVSDIQI